MEKFLFYDILKEFSHLSGIPAHVIIDNKVEFTTLQHDALSDKLVQFSDSFDRNGVDIRVYNGIEYFARIMAEFDSVKAQIILGTAFRAHPISVGFKGSLVSAMLINSNMFKEYLLSLPTVREENFVRFVSIMSRMTGGSGVTSDVITHNDNPLRKKLDGELIEYVFDTRENELNPYAPEVERRIMEMVRSGDVDGCKRINVTFSTNAPGLQVKYLFKIVALVTVATRAAVESGVDSVQAYGLSDLYLTRLGNANTDKQVAEIARSVLPQFAQLVQKVGKTQDDGYSPHLSRAMKYIKTHLHFPLSLSVVAENVGVSEKYLSRLFVKYKQEKFTAYVNRQRVLEAKDLLVNTDMKLIDIAYSLAFVSESYFIKIFDDMVGMTPQKYRNKYKIGT